MLFFLPFGIDALVISGGEKAFSAGLDVPYLVSLGDDRARLTSSWEAFFDAARGRGKMHAAPDELTRQLPPPARNHRYVTIGGHIGLVDDRNNRRRRRDMLFSP